MTIDDYDEVLALLRETSGVSVRAADSREGIARYLARNPGLSLVARNEEQLVGCVFAGHDGRRGSLHHLAVRESRRRAGVGRLLVTFALEGLQRAGIEKTHIDVFADNVNAIAFWKQLGWEQRSDLVRFSFNRSSDPNA